MTESGSPRIAPLAPSEWTAAQRIALDPSFREARHYNMSGTLARHPRAYEKFRPWAAHFLREDSCSLPLRQREMLILRTLWLCRAAYPWAQHVAIAVNGAALTLEEIDRIKGGAAAEGWSAAEATLLCAVDELHREQVVSDSTWELLRREHDTQQLMDIVFTVGQYTLVAMAARSFGLQHDRNLPPGGFA